MAASTTEHAVFVYGSLMWPSVLTVLLRRLPAARPAVLSGFCRKRVVGQPYPALVEEIRGCSSCTVCGLILTVNDDELVVLDEYEDDDYVLRSLKPTLVEIEASPFVWATNPSSRVLESIQLNEVEAIAYCWNRDSGLQEGGAYWEPEVDFAPNEEDFVSTLRECYCK